MILQLLFRGRASRSVPVSRGGSSRGFCAPSGALVQACSAAPATAESGVETGPSEFEAGPGTSFTFAADVSADRRVSRDAAGGNTFSIEVSGSQTYTFWPEGRAGSNSNRSLSFDPQSPDQQTINGMDVSRRRNESGNFVYTVRLGDQAPGQPAERLFLTTTSSTGGRGYYRIELARVPESDPPAPPPQVVQPQPPVPPAVVPIPPADETPSEAVVPMMMPPAPLPDPPVSIDIAPRVVVPMDPARRVPTDQPSLLPEPPVTAPPVLSIVPRFPNPSVLPSPPALPDPPVLPAPPILPISPEMLGPSVNPPSGHARDERGAWADRAGLLVTNAALIQKLNALSAVFEQQPDKALIRVDGVHCMEATRPNPELLVIRVSNMEGLAGARRAEDTMRFVRRIGEWHLVWNGEGPGGVVSRDEEAVRAIAPGGVAGIRLDMLTGHTVRVPVAHLGAGGSSLASHQLESGSLSSSFGLLHYKLNQTGFWAPGSTRVALLSGSQRPVHVQAPTRDRFIIEVGAEGTNPSLLFVGHFDTGPNGERRLSVVGFSNGRRMSPEQLREFASSPAGQALYDTINPL